jgi:hypothetical protein
MKLENKRILGMRACAHSGSSVTRALTQQ